MSLNSAAHYAELRLDLRMIGETTKEGSVLFAAAEAIERLEHRAVAAEDEVARLRKALAKQGRR